MKIIVSCNSGPELLELLALENAWMHEEVLLYADKSKQLDEFEGSYRIEYALRVGLNPFLFVKSLLDGIALVLKAKPEIVITIPSSTTFGLMFFAKLSGAKIVAIEPFCNTHHSNFFSGLAYRFADLFLVQWADLLDKYPKAEYVGSVF